jgi:hypothetical protein
MAALATEAVLSPAAGAWFGMQLDRRYGWSPYAMIAGLVLGGAVALKLFLEMGRWDDEKKDDESGSAS